MDTQKVYKFLKIAVGAFGGHSGTAIIKQLRKHSGIICTIGIVGNSIREQGMEFLFHI